MWVYSDIPIKQKKSMWVKAAPESPRIIETPLHETEKNNTLQHLIITF